jgi:kynurenine formamidase
MRAAAARSVTSGRVVALGREFAPDTAHLRRFEYRMIRYEDPLPGEAGAIDVVTLMCHGFAVTHVDALCHFFTPEGKAGMYNGHSIDHVTPVGARKLGIERIGEVGITGRGVLLDIAALRGGPLPVGSAIGPQDLELAEKAQNVRVGEGDILFVRNGAGAGNTHERGTGLTASCVPWLKARGVAALSGDSDSDIHPPVEGIRRWVEPIHMIGIPYLGLVLLDNADLDELAEVCTAENRFSFFVSVAPWRLKGATGGAVNPLAMF